MAPINSEKDPITTSFLRDSALDPYDVANPFAASFDPIENDINRLSIITNIIQMSILFISKLYFIIMGFWGFGTPRPHDLRGVRGVRGGRRG